MAMPGCSSTAGPEDGGMSPPAGNPLEQDNALTHGADEPGAGPGSGAGPAVDVCSRYVDRQLECGIVGGYNYYGYDYSPEDYVAICRAALDELVSSLGPGCADAFADLYACIASQDCDSFACSSEQNAVDVACGLDDPGTTGG